MKSIRIGNDIRIEWPIVLSGDVSKLQDLDLTVEVRPSRNVVDWHNYIEQPTLYRGKQTVMMNGGMEFRPDMGDGKEHCTSHRPKPPVPPVKLPYHIENNTLIAMWTADRQFAVGDYDIIVYAHKNGGGQAVADTYRFVRLVPHTAQADDPDNSGIEAVITMQPLTLSLSGLSAYEVAVVNGFQGSVEEWLESLKAGKLSSYVSVESIDNLPQQGDESTGYIIGTKLYIYVGTGGDTLEGKYKDVGEFRGPQGAPGSNGKSAYELAVEGGYEGSVEEWLLSLKGRDGVDGVNGKDGLDGENGKDGLDGENGKDGVTPLIRWNNNRLEQSTDNGKSWWALSDKFNNKLYIKGYVTSADKLPKNALVGDMYGVGPIYGDDDVEQTKPYYQVYVNTVTDWAKTATITKVYQGDTELPQSAENNEIILIKKSTDNYLVYKYVNGSWNLLANLAEIYVEKDDIVNRGDNIFALVQSEIENQYELYERVVSWRNSGTFTSITAGIVNELGDSENAVMSQKAVTDELNNINANTGVDDYPVFSASEAYSKGKVVNYNGKLYKFTADHAAGAWTGTDVEETDVVKAHIVQELGNSEDKVLSQKAVTKINALYDAKAVYNINDPFICNLFDVNSEDNVSGYLTLYGSIESSDVWITTHYIPFTKEMEKLTALSGPKHSKILGGGAICFYDEYKKFIKSAGQSGELNNTVTWEDGVYYVRFSIRVKDTNGDGEISDICVLIGDYEGIFVPSLSCILKDDILKANNIPNGLITPEKTVFFDHKNLFDPTSEDYIENYFLTNGGNLQENQSYAVSNFIPFTKEMGTLIASIDGQVITGGGFICLYNKDKTFIYGDQAGNLGGKISWQETAAFARFSIYNYKKGRIQIEVGDTVTDYVEPGYKLKENYIPNGLITPEKTVFFDHKNLFDPTSEDYIENYFLTNGGNLQENQSYAVSNFIPFTKEMGTLIASIDGQVITGGGFICLYNKDKTFIYGDQAGNLGGKISWQETAAFARFSIYNYKKGRIQIEVGDTVTDYVEPGYKLKENYIPNGLITDEERKDIENNQKMFSDSLGGNAAALSQDTLSPSSELTLTDYPYFIKKGLCLSFEANITQFNSIIIGKGYQKYRGEYLVIDNTNITLKFYENRDSQLGQVAHNLTIGTFIKVIMRGNNSDELFVILQTLSGTFTHKFGGFNYYFSYEAFVRTDSATTLTDIKFTGTNADLRLPVWAIGDSYFGISTNRWPGYMKEWGFFNFLLNGLAGQGSAAAYSDLERMLNFGTPKYLLWCLGMNDNDSTFKTNFDKVKILCADKGITLIASTIPTVPDRDKEVISQYVKDSGVRYIDFYNAVGTNENGEWFDGYLDTDNVHPTSIGAQALASQVLVDFPELMQYSLIGTNSEIGDTEGDL